MPVGYSPWNDAAEMGRQIGGQMSQALIQIPQQRREFGLQQQHLAMQAQQMQNAMAMRQAMMEFQQQKLDELNQYRGQIMDLKKQGLDEAGRHNQEIEYWRQQLNNRPVNVGPNGMYFPQGQQQQDPTSWLGPVGNAGLGVNPFVGTAPQQPQGLGQGTPMPNGGTFFPPPAKTYNNQLTPNQFYAQDDKFSNRALGLQRLTANGTTNQFLMPLFHDTTNQQAQFRAQYPQYSGKKQGLSTNSAADINPNDPLGLLQ